MLSPHPEQENPFSKKETQIAIPLPDDNAKAIFFVLASMHMAFPYDEFDITPGDMVDIAQICDKYGCAQKLWPTTHATLDLIGHYADQDTYYKSPAEAGDALVAAAVLKHITMAYRLGHAMLGHFTQKIQCSPKGETILPLLTTDIFNQLEMQRRSIKHSLGHAIETEIHQLSRWCEARWHNTYCSSTNSLVSNFLSCIGGQARLWPTGELTSRGLSDIAETMSWFAPQAPECSCWMTDAENTCASNMRWLAACTGINDAGKNALLEMESLGYHTELDRDGKLVGFVSEGRNAWRWYGGRQRV